MATPKKTSCSMSSTFCTQHFHISWHRVRNLDRPQDVTEGHQQSSSIRAMGLIAVQQSFNSCCLPFDAPVSMTKLIGCQ
eukprot:1154648-Pelagomonas_calceolata.AAC.8